MFELPAAHSLPSAHDSTHSCIWLLRNVVTLRWAACQLLLVGDFKQNVRAIPGAMITLTFYVIPYMPGVHAAIHLTSGLKKLHTNVYYDDDVSIDTLLVGLWRCSCFLNISLHSRDHSYVSGMF